MELLTLEKIIPMTEVGQRIIATSTFASGKELKKDFIIGKLLYNVESDMLEVLDSKGHSTELFHSQYSSECMNDAIWSKETGREVFFEKRRARKGFKKMYHISDRTRWFASGDDVSSAIRNRARVLKGKYAGLGTPKRTEKQKRYDNMIERAAERMIKLKGTW